MAQTIEQSLPQYTDEQQNAEHTVETILPWPWKIIQDLNTQELKYHNTYSQKTYSQSKFEQKYARYCETVPTIAIIVPFMEIFENTEQMSLELSRTQQKRYFIDQLTELYTNLKRDFLVDMDIFFIEQDHYFDTEEEPDFRNLKFNRGKLLNIGFIEASRYHKRYSNYIFHDVDLIPSSELFATYFKFVPRNQCIHYASSWDRYNSPEIRKTRKGYYVGGILGMSYQQFTKCNGFPNNIWGLQKEDDVLYLRMKDNRIKVQCIYKDLMDVENMNIDEKMTHLRENLHWKNMVQEEYLAEYRKYNYSGLQNCNYTILNMYDSPLLEMNNVFTIIVNIELNGDKFDQKSRFYDNVWGFNC